MMIIVVILVGVLVYYTFNANNSNNNSNTRNNPTNLGTISNSKQPLDILNERFAKGEIEESEYLKKKDILNQ